ncbi:hypothetical protein [Nocardia aurantiaca]|uniref:hypothetical protein n=1 Tax=Nocardia aurantiaca TaxID=2675850 RepID=UPI0012B8F0F2|nr:hypothetical protein [Nocardia aurantiaca]
MKLSTATGLFIDPMPSLVHDLTTGSPRIKFRDSSTMVSFNSVRDRAKNTSAVVRVREWDAFAVRFGIAEDAHDARDDPLQRPRAGHGGHSARFPTLEDARGRSAVGPQGRHPSIRHSRNEEGPLAQQLRW